jgi:hypothetical protein
MVRSNLPPVMKSRISPFQATLSGRYCLPHIFHVGEARQIREFSLLGACTIPVNIM